MPRPMVPVSLRPRQPRRLVQVLAAARGTVIPAAQEARVGVWAAGMLARCHAPADVAHRAVRGPANRRAAGTQAPGGAGGAVTLVSCRSKLSVQGVIDAVGGGELPDDSRASRSSSSRRAELAGQRWDCRAPSMQGRSYGANLRERRRRGSGRPRLCRRWPSPGQDAQRSSVARSWRCPAPGGTGIGGKWWN